MMLEAGIGGVVDVGVIDVVDVDVGVMVVVDRVRTGPRYRF